MPGVGSSSPAVLIAHLAASTSRIRVGSGGVMLPNHQPLVVAEQFGTLEALHPGRIDLGIGRAPGTDPRTAAALRRGTGPLGADDFPEQLTELMAYFHGDGPVLAVPAVGHRPAIWLLGSSGYSAQVAGLLGLPFAFAHHFSGHNTMAALALYRETFRPSAVLAQPYSMIAAAVLAADTDARGAPAGRCRARCSSCGCARAGPGWCRPRRRRPPTRTPPRSGPSSRTGWPVRWSAPRTRSATASASWSSAPGWTS